MRKYYDRVAIVFIHDKKKYGAVDSLGVYSSIVRHMKDQEEVSELMYNEDFVIIDEIVFEHMEVE